MQQSDREGEEIVRRSPNEMEQSVNRSFVFAPACLEEQLAEAFTVGCHGAEGESCQCGETASGGVIPFCWSRDHWLHIVDSLVSTIK